MLFTKCILSKSSPDDGLRVSVMSRHTLNDGVTPDSRIQTCHFHIPKFGPSPKLIGAYYRNEIDWNIFEKKYLAQIRSKPEIISNIRFFIEYAMSHSLTFLCVEEKADFCHRRLLTDECQRLEPNLVVEHR